MGVKYSVQYRDNFNQQCKVDISHPDWDGAITVLRGVGGKACEIERDCEDDPYDTIINTKATISFYQTTDLPVDILELQLAQDREFTVKFYIDSALKFSGFMVADGIGRIFQQTPFEVTINATDGLYLLDGIRYTPDLTIVDNVPSARRSIINVIRWILGSDENLGNLLPIQWVNTLINDEFPLEEDVFSGSLEWGVFFRIFEEYDGIDLTKDCYYVLDGILKSMQCRIVQDDGIWKIQRINDVVSGEYTALQIPITATNDDLDITTVEIDAIRQIEGVQDNLDFSEYCFIEEDAILTVLPALKSVTTTYEQDERENIISNGGMDTVNTLTNQPVYWTTEENPDLTFESIPSIYSDRGFAVRIESADTGSKSFKMIAPLPIDTDILYTSIDFGFKFIPVSGFPLNIDDTINWAAGLVFGVLITFKDNNGTDWYFAEGGFWVNDYVPYIQTAIEGAREGDVISVNFNAFQNMPLLAPANAPIEQENEPSIEISFWFPVVCTIDLDDVYLKVEKQNDKYLALVEDTKNTAKEEYTLNISSSHNGFYVSNFMTSFAEAGAQKFFSDTKTASVTLTNMNSQAIMRNRYKPSLMFEGSVYAKNYSYSEIYNIKTLTGKNFLPLRSKWNTETNTVLLTCVEVRDDEIELQVTQNGVSYGE